MHLLLLVTLLWWAAPVLAEGFLCAGSQGAPTEAALPSGVASKPARTAQSGTTGTRRALVLFARFKGENTTLPSWAADIFNPELPGSFSHFYDTMSFGKLQVRGEVASRVYESAQPASAYLAANSSEQGRFGQFVQEVLRQADGDIDFAQFDNDGPDGIPNSRDDDGVVDAVFLVLERIPTNFLQGEATGILGLGISEALVTRDTGAGGKGIQIFPGQGTIQQGRSFAEAMGAICHEYGHVLGLPDLYNTEFLGKKGAGPEEDSAGVGAWCLMGWGASGWNGDDGPNSFCAWSRMKLGWALVEEPKSEEQEVALEPVGQSGQLYLIPIGEAEFFLLEYRTRTGTYYDRRLPGEGLLIWHVGYVGYPLSRLAIDLECADGRWRDVGFPVGKEADVEQGEDNLDFWAHDEGYSSVHAGNLGDATDPFDGVQLGSFTPQSNPSSRTLDGRGLVRVEDIRATGDRMQARVQTASPAIEVAFAGLIDRDGDGSLTFGEEAAVNVQLINRGGLPANEVEVQLKTDDPLIEIQQAGARFGALGVGHLTGRPLGGLLRIKLARMFTRNQEIALQLEVFADGRLVHRQVVPVRAISTYTLRGQIKNTEGKGIARLSIFLQLSVDPWSGYVARTDSAGFYQFDLPPGSYLAWVQPPRDLRLGEVRFTQRILGDTQRDLVLQPLVSVPGTVRDHEGNPLAGIEIHSDFSAGVSAGDGTFAMTLEPGFVDLTFGRRSTALLRNIPRQRRRVLVAEGTRLEIVLEQGVRVEVQATDEAGKAVRAATVRMSSPNGEGQGAIDAQGHLAVEVVPGVYTLSLSGVKLPYAERDLYPVSVTGDTAIRLAVGKSARISGQIGNAWLASGRFFLVPLDGDRGVDLALSPEGTYETRVPNGRFLVGFISSGLTPTQSLGVIDVTADEGFDFELESGEKTRGQVLGPEEQGLEGIEVQACSPAMGLTGNGLTHEGGTFEIFLKRGEYELAAVAGGDRLFWNLGTAQVDLLERLTVRAPGGTRLQGRVLDGVGRPLENALVMITRDPRSPVMIEHPLLAGLGTIRLFKQGPALEVAGLSNAEGKYQLEARAGHYAAVVLPTGDVGLGKVVRDFDLTGDRTMDFSLDTPEKTLLVYGRIWDEPDLPRGIVLLQFYDEARGVLAQTKGFEGRGYCLELPAGGYQVRAALAAPTGGLQKVYELGRVVIDKDARWDVDLADAATAVTEETAATPQHFSLSPNYPNPFNPTTTIGFSLSQPGEAELAIYNLLGQRVATLVKGVQEAGLQVLQWNGRDDQGRELASGVYFYRLQAGVQVETRKLLLLR